MSHFMLRFGLCFIVAAPWPTLAQVNPGDSHMPGPRPCIDSPTPGKLPANVNCALLQRKNIDRLPPGPLVWRFENFSTPGAARTASTPASAVVEAQGKVWLITLGAPGDRSKGATFVAESEPLPPIPAGPSYEIVFGEADLSPGAVMTHKHSGPETWLVLTGQQCLELPDRAVRARAGETMSAPAETPMKLNILGPGKRDVLFLIVHDSSKPWITFLEDWQPKGLCQK